MANPDKHEDEALDAYAAAPRPANEPSTSPFPDPALLARLQRHSATRRRVDSTLTEALAHPMKPFVLWDVPRDILEPASFRTERAERATLELRRPRPPLPRLRPVCSEALDSFVPASRIALRAYKGLSAAIRLLLREPPRPRTHLIER